jgi:hypothetical protein
VHHTDSVLGTGDAKIVDESHEVNGASHDGPLDGSGNEADKVSEPNGATKGQALKRKSIGVPEHRTKKTLGKKKSTVNLASQPDPEVGDYRLARVKGFPPWPCIVCEDEMLPDSLILKRPVGAKRPDGTYKPDYADGGKKVNERSFPVLFLQTNDL